MTKYDKFGSEKNKEYFNFYELKFFTYPFLSKQLNFQSVRAVNILPWQFKKRELNITHFNTCLATMIEVLSFVHIQIWPKLKKYVNNLNKIHDLKAKSKPILCALDPAMGPDLS